MVSPYTLTFDSFLFTSYPSMFSTSNSIFYVEENISSSTFSSFSSKEFVSIFSTKCASSSNLLWVGASIYFSSSDSSTSLISFLAIFYFCSLSISWNILPCYSFHLASSQLAQWHLWNQLPLPLHWMWLPQGYGSIPLQPRIPILMCSLYLDRSHLLQF